LFEQRLNLNEFEAKKDSQSEVLFFFNVFLVMNILADRLMLLEKYALINKINFNEVPPRVEYWLTENGIELSELLDVMCKFSERIVLRDEAIKC